MDQCLVRLLKWVVWNGLCWLTNTKSLWWLQNNRYVIFLNNNPHDGQTKPVSWSYIPSALARLQDSIKAPIIFWILILFWLVPVCLIDLQGRLHCCVHYVSCPAAYFWRPSPETLWSCAVSLTCVILCRLASLPCPVHCLDLAVLWRVSVVHLDCQEELLASVNSDENSLPRYTCQKSWASCKKHLPNRAECVMCSCEIVALTLCQQNQQIRWHWSQNPFRGNEN